MNNASVQVGDYIYYAEQIAPNRLGKVQSLGVVTHVGETLENWHVRSFIVNGKEINTDDAKYSHPNEFIVVPPTEQWPQALTDYIATFPSDLQKYAVVIRKFGRFKIADSRTLEIAYVKMTSIEVAELDYDTEPGYFGHNKPSIDTSQNILVLALAMRSICLKNSR